MKHSRLGSIEPRKIPVAYTLFAELSKSFRIDKVLKRSRRIRISPELRETRLGMSGDIHVLFGFFRTPLGTSILIHGVPFFSLEIIAVGMFLDISDTFLCLVSQKNKPCAIRYGG